MKLSYGTTSDYCREEPNKQMDIGATWSWSGNGFKMGTEQRILTEKGTELYKAISTQETVGSTQEIHR